MTSTTATASIVYRGVPYQKGEVHHANGISRQGTPLLNYRGVSYSTRSAGFRIKATPITDPTGRVIELQFLGNHYQRTL